MEESVLKEHSKDLASHSHYIQLEVKMYLRNKSRDILMFVLFVKLQKHWILLYNSHNAPQ